MMKKLRFKPVLTLLAALFIIGCSTIGANHFYEKYGESQPRDRAQPPNSDSASYFNSAVKPVLESRCVVCHACYDAPCQLNLTSPAGIERGITDTPVYQGTRLLATTPTRLGIDHQTTVGWREENFYPILNEFADSPEANLNASVLFHTLMLKAAQPQNIKPVLDGSKYNFALNRQHECPTIEEYEEFAQDNPEKGMPFGLPAIPSSEHVILTNWLQAGAMMSSLDALSEAEISKIKYWEEFLNQQSAKLKLVSRYLYEHLFLAHLFFGDESTPIADRRYFKLVRSRTPTGTTIDIINTRRPSTSPGNDAFYYRLKPVDNSIVSKTFMPYHLDEQRMEQWQELFVKPNYTVSKMPGYEHRFINPFVTFKAIPATSRYLFLLENAKYFIEGFIKGPVCRGQRAVKVIEDHFWVFFIDPLTEATPLLDGFIESQAKNLGLPGEEGSTSWLIGPWLEYSERNRDYLQAKRNALLKLFNDTVPLDESLVWDGMDNRGNAALTVFRHFDNATVLKGLIGDHPKTTWIIDYPLLERIHYLLTVDFDVFGNIGHQLNTRLYMDFLRMEGELNFLLLLPPEERKRVHQHWYRNADNHVTEHIEGLLPPKTLLPQINYATADTKAELLDILKNRVLRSLDTRFAINQNNTDKALLPVFKQLASVGGKAVNQLAEHTNLLVIDGEQSVAYSLVANRGHANVTSLLSEKKERLPEEDTLTVTYGIAGDYPNAFLRVDKSQLAALVAVIENIETPADYAELLAQYGVRRTDPQFWSHSDDVHRAFHRQQPEMAGWLDFNRIENR